MKIYAKLDEEKRILSYRIILENEILLEDEKEAFVEKEEDIIIGKTKIIDGLIKEGDTFNKSYKEWLDKLEKNNKIKELEYLLTSTDYKVIKCYEAFMMKKVLPYDLNKLIYDRDLWREEINDLQKE